MHRQPLLSLLKAYQYFEEDEREFREQIIQFVENQPLCFERTLAVGHITGSAWIISEDRQRVLLTHHRKLNRWLQPGGHADGNPDIVAVATQEAIEETGLKSIKLVAPKIYDVDIHVIPARKQEPEHLHYDIRFLFTADPSEAFVISEESNDLAWVRLAELHRYNDERSVLRLAEKSKQLLFF